MPEPVTAAGLTVLRYWLSAPRILHAYVPLTAAQLVVQATEAAVAAGTEVAAADTAAAAEDAAGNTAADTEASAADTVVLSEHTATDI